MKKSIREAVWNKYDQHCAYCGKEIRYKEMQVDHLKPVIRDYEWDVIKKQYVSNGKMLKPENDKFENFMPCCRRCNHYKRSLHLEDFRERIKTIHKRIRKQYIVKVALDYGILHFEKWDGLFYFERTKNEQHR